MIRQADNPLPRVSVVIPTHNGARRLGRLLDSLARQRGLGEVVVVDNASTDATADVCAAAAARLPLRCIPEPTLGLTRARMAGIEAAEGDFVIIVDDDISVEDGWLEAYRQAMRDWPDTAGFGGPVQPVLPADAPAWLLETTVASYAFARHHLGDTPTAYAWPMAPCGGNMALRRELLLDERFTFRFDLGWVGQRRTRSGCEVEMFGRLVRAGFAIRYVPRAAVHHHLLPIHATRPYLRRRSYANGRGSARLRPVPPNMPCLLGVPRYLWRMGGEALVDVFRQRMAGRGHDVFEAEMRLCRTAGEIVERYASRGEDAHEA